MEFSEFTEYYQELVSNCAIVDSFNTKEWLESCEESHKEIAEFLPSDVILEQAPLLDTKGVPPDRIINPYINKVLEIMPTYLTEYGIKSGDLKSPMLKHPMRIKTLKHILGYAQRSELNITKTGELYKVVSKMGEIWKECKNSYDEQGILISFNPKSFIHIGCSGVNVSSCWRRGSRNKFGFGIAKNTFCWYLVSKNNLDPIKNAFNYKKMDFWENRRSIPPSPDDLYIARGLGWLDLEQAEMCIFNTYGRQTEYSYLANTWGGLYKKWFGVPDEKEVHTQELGGSLTTSSNSSIFPAYFNPRFISFSNRKSTTASDMFSRLVKILPAKFELEEKMVKVHA